MEGKPEILVSVSDLNKGFPGVQALSHVNFELREGEVHILLGENGAGKSTLIKVLSGVYAPDSGAVMVAGRQMKEFTSWNSRKLGISTVFQELSLVADLTVEENISLGHEPLKHSVFGLVDRSKQREMAVRFLDYVGCKAKPEQRVGELGAAQQQLVEIAKALSQNPRVLILDEPTDKLFGEEQETLFGLLQRMKGEGKGIIYITHKLEEVPRIGDRVTVLRDGRVVGTASVDGLTTERMVRMMAGRELGELFPKEEVPPGPEVLRLEDLCVGNVLSRISFSLAQGEVLGIMGLVGSGRTLLAKTIAGVARPTAGRIYYRGRQVRINNPSQSVGLGIAFLPEDRRAQGLVTQLPVRENIILPSLRSWLLNYRELNRLSMDYVRRLNIRTPSIFVPVAKLSGGNQQKVVLAKWLCSRCSLFIFDEPTQGIDVATKVEVYRFINSLAREGAAIILISSDTKELLGMSDRIVVMRRGRIVSEYRRHEATQERILSDALLG